MEYHMQPRLNRYSSIGRILQAAFVLFSGFWFVRFVVLSIPTLGESQNTLRFILASLIFLLWPLFELVSLLFIWRMKKQVAILLSFGVAAYGLSFLGALPNCVLGLCGDKGSIIYLLMSSAGTAAKICILMMFKHFRKVSQIDGQVVDASPGQSIPPQS